MRILHVVYSLIPTEFRGGIPKIVYGLACAQADLGHEVHIFATNYNSGVRVAVPIGQTVESRGVFITYFHASMFPELRSEEMRRALEKHASSFDVIHSHNTFLSMNRMAANVASARRVSIFYHTHGALDPVVLKKGLWKSIKKRIYIRCFEAPNLNRASGVFANTAVEREQLTKCGVQCPVHILRNGIEISHEADLETGLKWRVKYDILEHQRVVLYIGRFHPKKGLHLLIKAFSVVAKVHPDLVLCVGGDRAQFPEYVSRLDKLVDEERLKGRVIWLGFLKESEKGTALSTCTVFCHVSESEGMAMSILEAMAAAKPVLVGEGCNMDDAARAAALKVCEFRSDSIAAALLEVVSDRAVSARLGQAALDYVVKMHNWHEVARESVRVYGSV